jgi:hypothetical protein
MTDRRAFIATVGGTFEKAVHVSCALSGKLLPVDSQTGRFARPRVVPQAQCSERARVSSVGPSRRLVREMQ